jgi:hypothetical protein
MQVNGHINALKTIHLIIVSGAKREKVCNLDGKQLPNGAVQGIQETGRSITPRPI